METEVWKQMVVYDANQQPLTGFDKYYISNLGRVKVVKTTKTIILKQHLDYSRKKNEIENRFNTAYYEVKLCALGKRCKRKVHRLVAMAFIPNPENKPQVNHKDGIKLNNNVSNLEWSTHLENQDHATINGLRPYGENNGTSKLTEKQVVEIKNLLFENNLMQKEIAKIYNVSSSRISAINVGKGWKHLEKI